MGKVRGEAAERLPLASRREFIATRDILDDYIRVLDACCGEGFADAGYEGGDDVGVPSCVDDGDTEVGACGGKSVSVEVLEDIVLWGLTIIDLSIAGAF